jgi:hypothetical protein
LRVLTASNEGEIDAAFATLAQQAGAALTIGTNNSSTVGRINSSGVRPGMPYQRSTSIARSGSPVA